MGDGDDDVGARLLEFRQVLLRRFDHPQDADLALQIALVPIHD